MAYPQGINFRSTLIYVTDGANESMATANNFAAAYPVTTTQGNIVGWEGALGNIRDRNASNDRRLAGVHFTATTQTDFRFDLPAAGSYNIRLAAGDAGGVNQANWLLVDGTTVLLTMTSGTNVSGNSFRDATNTLLTAAAWPGSNTAITQTFATTICRIRSTTTGNDAIAHAYIEAASGGTQTYSYTASGGMSLAGSATRLRGRVLAGLGGLTFSGAASLVFTAAVQSLTVTPVGGLIISGASAMVRTIVKAVSGGVTFAGSSAISLTPDPNPATQRHFKRGRRPRTKT